ncbi:MAG: hypothetical protein AB7E79_04015 [Rhodospirillaceae bacterium]
MRTAALVLLLPTAAFSADAEMQTPPLTLTFSSNQALCAAAEKAVATEPPCRAFDSASCPKPDVLKFRPLASDQYGSTEVALAPEIPSAKFNVVYLQRFKGDQLPRLLETWKIDRARLQSVFALPPGRSQTNGRQRPIFWGSLTPSCVNAPAPGIMAPITAAIG